MIISKIKKQLSQVAKIHYHMHSHLQMLIQLLKVYHQDNLCKKKLHLHWKCSLHIFDIRFQSCSLQPSMGLNENFVSDVVKFTWKLANPHLGIRVEGMNARTHASDGSQVTIFAVIFWCWSGCWKLCIWTTSTKRGPISTVSVFFALLTSAFSHVVSSRARRWIVNFFPMLYITAMNSFKAIILWNKMMRLQEFYDFHETIQVIK